MEAEAPLQAVAGAVASEQVRVQFHTGQADVQLPEHPGPILLSTGLKRYALSTLINTLLATPDSSPIPFSFLIDGRFLTTSLSEYLTEHGLSAESILDVEYVRAALPPTPQASFEHDDWVSGIDILSSSSPAGQVGGTGVYGGPERVASASYDGIVRVWDMSGTVVAQSQPVASDMPSHLLATRFLSPTSLASTGFDGKIHVHAYDAHSPTLNNSLTLLGHRHIVSSLDAHCASQRLLSASSDNTAMLWSTSATSPLPPVPTSLPSHITSSSTGDGSSTKRRKHAPAGPQAGPLLTLRKHTRPVSAAVFAAHDSTVGYTASADRQLLTWDLTTGACVSSRVPVAQEPLTCLAATAGGLLVAGTGAGGVLLVDPREQARRPAVGRGRAHRHGVTGVDVEPAGTGGGHGFASCARGGGELFVWDARNVSTAAAGPADDGGGAGSRALQPVFRVPRQRAASQREGWAVLAVRWDAAAGLASGGEDRRVQVDRAPA